MAKHKSKRTHYYITFDAKSMDTACAQSLIYKAH